MGSVELVEKTLPLNDMIHYVHKDADLRERWLTDLKGVCDEFGLFDEEYQALKDVDVKCLMEIGTHQYLIPHILRLLEDGDHDKMLRECTLEVMEEAGSGGTAELISWFFAMAFTEGPAEVLGYAPSHTWRSGTGFAIWHNLAPELRLTAE